MEGDAVDAAVKREKRPLAEAITNRRLKPHVGKLRDEVNLAGVWQDISRFRRRSGLVLREMGIPATFASR